jgi:beta-phosphoglucomutase
MVKGVIFDLDGVLVDTENLHFDCLNEALSFYNLKINKIDYEKLSGVGTLTRLKMLLPNADRDTLRQAYELKGKLTIQHSKNIPLSDGALELINYLKSKGIKLALASNARKDFVAFILSNLNLDKYFDFVISADSITTSKPNPEIFTISMTQLGVSPEETVIFEDSIAGLQAAFASGAHVIAVTEKQPLSLDNFIKAFPNLNAQTRKNHQ